MTASAVKKATDEWNLADRIIRAACFDTTASNTGRRSGACHLLEQLLQKSLLYLPCRHHILELVSDNVLVAQVVQITECSPVCQI